VATLDSSSPFLAQPLKQPAALVSRPFFEDKNRAFWMLQAGGWTGYLLLRTVSSVSNSQPIEGAIAGIVEAIIGYCLTLLLSALYGTYRKLPRVPSILLTLATLGVATIIYAVLDAFIYSFVRMPTPGITLTLVTGTVFINFTVLAGWSALYFAINFYLIVEQQIDQMQTLEIQASQAQLAMLRYQLNPHFLFNTLNSISTLVLLKQTERANIMLSRLSSFLRYTLANEPTAHVTLQQEAETLKLYLEIEKMRFDERLRTHFEIDRARRQGAAAVAAAPAFGRKRDQICRHAAGRGRRYHRLRSARRRTSADRRIRHRSGIDRSQAAADPFNRRGARQYQGAAWPKHSGLTIVSRRVRTQGRVQR
jgi:hypothetical protein